MSMPLPAATARIARQLRDAETKADAALLAATELMATLIQARSNPAVAVHTGQRALHRLVRAQQSIIEGSSDIFRVHDEMSTIGREMCLLDEDGSTPKSGLLEVEPTEHVA
jgi:hypothetical protein